MASAQKKPKKDKGVKNPDRKNGKSWKGGLSPVERERLRMEKLASRTPEQQARQDARRQASIARRAARKAMVPVPEEGPQTSGD